MPKSTRREFVGGVLALTCARAMAASSHYQIEISPQVINPGTRVWDFSLAKNTSIREGQSLQFRFEAFNLPNHPNWNPPSTDATSRTTFGVVTSAKTMRELQFGLKYLF